MVFHGVLLSGFRLKLPICFHSKPVNFFIEAFSRDGLPARVFGAPPGVKQDKGYANFLGSQTGWSEYLSG